MNDINVLEWTNENQLSSFPFEANSIIPLGYITDAVFYALSGSLIRLVELRKTDTGVYWRFDVGGLRAEGTQTTTSFTVKDEFGRVFVEMTTLPVSNLRDLLNTASATLNIRVIEAAVNRLPKDAGLYTFNGFFGAVSMGLLPADSFAWVNFGGKRRLDAKRAGAPITGTPLKTINGISHDGSGNFYLQGNNILTVSPSDNSVKFEVIQ